MDLIEHLSEELVLDDELDKVKGMKGVEEEMTKFQEKIKETVENLSKNVIAKNLVKMQSIEVYLYHLNFCKKFEMAVKHREAQNEKETIETLRKFEHEKKLSFRKHEN